MEGEGVFELKDGEESVLYGYGKQKERLYPEGALILDASGKLWGPASGGDGKSCPRSGACGMLFSLDSKSKSPELRTEHSFCNRPHCADGAAPEGPLFLDADGALFGTTADGGNKNKKHDWGTLYEWSKTGFAVLYAFCSQVNCGDGAMPVQGAIRDSSGNLFGTTSGGGANGYGVVFEYTP